MSTPERQLTRQGFLRTGLAFIGACTLPLGLGCPADDGGDEGAGSDEGGTTTAAEGDSTGSAAGCTMDPSVMISANHGHALVVPLADVTAGAEKTYDIMGTATHNHTLTLTADHFAMLQEGMQITVASSVDSMHSHQVTVSCA